MRETRSPRRRTPAASATPPAGVAVAQRVARHADQEVRILGGQWKRTPLPVPVAAGLRPTPSRVRETLFNWLGQDLTGWTVLDAFAGSGALGLEAASRGAQSVTLVERDPVLLKGLRSVVDKLKAADVVRLVSGDALSWMREGRQFDLVFLDPPFDADVFDQALGAARSSVLNGGWVYLEAPRPFDQVPTEGLKLVRHSKAGAVYFHLFQRVDEPGTVSTA